MSEITRREFGQGLAAMALVPVVACDASRVAPFKPIKHMPLDSDGRVVDRPWWDIKERQPVFGRLCEVMTTGRTTIYRASRVDGEEGWVFINPTLVVIHGVDVWRYAIPELFILTPDRPIVVLPEGYEIDSVAINESGKRTTYARCGAERLTVVQ